MGIFSKQHVSILKPFDEKYKLLVSSEIRTGNMTIESEIEIRWDVRVRSVSSGRIHLELLTLENRLVHWNNPIVKSLADMNRVLGDLYSELNLVIDDGYRLVEIRNLDLLSTKWKRIKADLEESIGDEPELLGAVINLNDKNFENPNLLFDLVRHNEFFTIYFHHLYGGTVPSTTDSVSKKNIFNTALVDWRYSLSSSGDADEYLIEGRPSTRLNKEWVKKHYAGFTHLDLEKIRPVMKEEGVYRLDPDTGQLVKATLVREETAHPELLYGTIRYELMQDKPVSARTKEPGHNPGAREMASSSGNEPPAGYDPRHSFILDE